MRRSAEVFFSGESSDAPIYVPEPKAPDRVPSHIDPASVTTFPGGRTQRICFNPLRAEPSATVVATVRRFGVVGLIFCALCTGFMRLVRSSTR